MLNFLLRQARNSVGFVFPVFDLLPCVGRFISPDAYFSSFPAMLMYHFMLTWEMLSVVCEAVAALLSYLEACHNAP